MKEIILEKHSLPDVGEVIPSGSFLDSPLFPKTGWDPVHPYLGSDGG